MLKLVRASRGGALLLFTSYRNMHRVYDYLRRHLGIDWPLMRQGEMGKQALINWLQGTEGAVLCATASFWEGVDVPGDALRLVAIDKIPFATPTPLERARAAAVQNPFYRLAIPEATLSLKQGFGRLIRTQTDRGVVALLDPRLWVERWGVRILEALPDAAVVQSIGEVEAWYRAERVMEGAA